MIPTRAAPIDLCFRNKTDRCFTFVNQRPVFSKEIEKVILSSLYPSSEIIILLFYLLADEGYVRLRTRRSEKQDVSNLFRLSPNARR